ncbi:MAG: DUF2147 domain-containing protein [Dongiaceae bacterium]
MRLIAGALFCTLLMVGPANAESLLGVWLHENQRIHIEIFPCEDLFCGKIVWLKFPNDEQGNPITDIENPDPALRDRALMGLLLLQGLRQTGPRSWENGQIYNPDDGENYLADMEMRADGTVDMRAYVLMPMLGKTLVWTPVDGPTFASDEMDRQP